MKSVFAVFLAVSSFSAAWAIAGEPLLHYQASAAVVDPLFTYPDTEGTPVGPINVARLTDLCGRGNGEACLDLGKCYFYGYTPCQLDLVLAEKYLRLAVALHRPMDCMLCALWQHDVVFKEDEGEALKCYLNNQDEGYDAIVYILYNYTGSWYSISKKSGREAALSYLRKRMDSLREVHSRKAKTGEKAQRDSEFVQDELDDETQLKAALIADDTYAITPEGPRGDTVTLGRGAFDGEAENLASDLCYRKVLAKYGPSLKKPLIAYVRSYNAYCSDWLSFTAYEEYGDGDGAQEEVEADWPDKHQEMEHALYGLIDKPWGLKSDETPYRGADRALNQEYAYMRKLVSNRSGPPWHMGKSFMITAEKDWLAYRDASVDLYRASDPTHWSDAKRWGVLTSLTEKHTAELKSGIIDIQKAD